MLWALEIVNLAVGIGHNRAAEDDLPGLQPHPDGVAGEEPASLQLPRSGLRPVTVGPLLVRDDATSSASAG